MTSHRSRPGVARLGIVSFVALASLFVSSGWWLRAHRHRLLDHRLIAAIERRDTRAARLLLIFGADPKATALRPAGRDPDTFGDYCVSALERAAWKGESDVVEALISRGALRTPDPSWRGEPLCAVAFAAAGGHDRIVQMLLQRGVVPSDPSCTYEFCNPLLAAALRGNVETMRVLLDHGADPNLRDIQDEPVLVSVAFEPLRTRRAIAEEIWLREVRLLLAKGADVHLCKGGNEDWSALGWALSRGDLRMAAILERAGARAPDYRVWVDLRSRRYHWRGCPKAGKTACGRWTYDAEARAAGYKPAACETP